MMRAEKIQAAKTRPSGALPQRSAVRQVLRRLYQDRFIYLMLLPVVAYLVIFKYWPMTWLSVSFFDYKLLKGFGGSKWVGLSNYIKFVRSSDFLRIVGNTLVLNIELLLLSFPFTIIFSLLLNEVKNMKYKKVVQTVSYLPHFISTVVLVTMINTILSPSVGVFGAIAKAFGNEPIYFMGQAKYFRPIYILSDMWQGTGWGAIIYLSAMTGIDPTLYEAATVDGANRFQQIWHITLPGIMGAIVIQLVMAIGNIMNLGFEKVYLMQNSLNIQLSEVLSTYVYKQGMLQTKFGYSMAVSVFNSVIALVLVVTANKLSKKLTSAGLW